MRYLLIAFLLVTSELTFAQKTQIDRIKVQLTEHPQQDLVHANLLNELSFWSFKDDLQQSFDYANRALALSQKLEFQQGIGEAKNNLSVYHLVEGHADVSLELSLEAARIGEREHLPELLANSYAILGTVYHNLKMYDKALHFLDEAGKINVQLKNPLLASKVFNALGGISRDRHQYDSALRYYKQALAVMEEAGDEYRKAEVLNNIGIIYVRLNHADLAKEFYFKSLEVARKNGNERAQALALANLGNSLLAEKKYREAETFLLQSLGLAKKIGDKNILSGNYMYLTQVKNETGKFDEAHRYMAQYYGLKDSLQNIERNNKIAELEIQYETEKKAHVIELLTRDNRIQMLWRNVLIGILLLLIGFAWLIYYFLKGKEHKNRIILNLEIDRLTSENKEISEKYKGVLQHGLQSSISSSDQKLFKKVIDVIEDNMRDTLFNVDKMAKELGMSRTNLHRKIKVLTGFPPSELIRNIRLRKAAELLLNKADTISQISVAVGFEDHSYFSKSFKKQFGVPPSEYHDSAVSHLSS